MDLAGTIQEVIPGFERDLACSGRVLFLTSMVRMGVSGVGPDITDNRQNSL